MARLSVHGRDGGRALAPIGFLTNYNTRTTPLDYKLLIMPWRACRGPAGPRRYRYSDGLPVIFDA